MRIMSYEKHRRLVARGDHLEAAHNPAALWKSTELEIRINGLDAALDRAFNFYNSLLTLHPGQRSIYGRIKRVKAKMEERE